jgi:serine/threonine protein kinase
MCLTNSFVVLFVAKFVDDKTYTLCGTPNYLSPEVIMNRGHNASSDHWALGVLLYEMVAGENPFYHDGMPQMELFQCIVREKFYPLPDEVSDEAFDVIDELLEKDPAQRLGSLAGRGKDIMAKAFFDELDLAELRQKKFKAPFIPKNKKLDEMVAQSSSGSLHYNDSFVSQSEGSFTLGTVVGSPSGSSAESPNASGYVNLHASAQKSKASLLDDSSDEED